MEQTHIDIYKQLKKNSWITKACIICATLIAIVAIFAISSAYNNADKVVYGLSKDYKMLPLEKIEKANLESIFVKGHIELFAKNFYEYDQWNYEDRIEKSLWLIDDSGKQLFQFYKKNGLINSLIQSSSSQRITEIDIKTEFETGQFLMTAILEINRDGAKNNQRYQLNSTGIIQTATQDYPKNPYGYQITNYKEISRTKI